MSSNMQNQNKDRYLYEAVRCSDSGFVNRASIIRVLKNAGLLLAKDPRFEKLKIRLDSFPETQTIELVNFRELLEIGGDSRAGHSKKINRSRFRSIQKNRLTNFQRGRTA